MSLTRHSAIRIAILAILMPSVALAAAEVAKAADAAERSAPQLLPTSTLLYVEISHPEKLIGRILDHPLARKLADAPELRNAMEQPKARELLRILSAIENQAGMTWRAALDAAAGNGMVIALEAWTQGVVGLVKSKDPQAAVRLRDTLFDLVRADASARGQPDPIKTVQLRGLTTHEVNGLAIAQLGPWLALSSKPQLLQSIADRARPGAAAPTLEDDQEFQQARAMAAPDGARPDAWAMLRLAPLRLLGLAKPLLNNTGKSDDFGAELLAGGIQSVMSQAPYVTSSLRISGDELRVSLATPFDRAWLPPERRFYFGGDDDGAPEPVRPRGTLLSLTAYRDLSALWQAGPDLFGEGVAAKMARTDSELSVFFGGKSFGAHVLGAIGPQLQLVVAAQDYKAAGVTEPAIRFPAGALVLSFRQDAAAIQKRLRVAFQSLVALANLDGAQKGRPLLEMGTETRAGAEIHFAMYESPGGDAGEAENPAMKTQAAGDIHLNFSPSLVLTRDQAILCSTRQIARDLADLVAGPGQDSAVLRHNTLLAADARAITDLLRRNRGQLVAQNMLEKGHEQAAADREIDTLLSLLGLLRDASVRLTPTDKSLTLELQVRAAATE